MQRPDVIAILSSGLGLQAITTSLPVPGSRERSAQATKARAGRSVVVPPSTLATGARSELLLSPLHHPVSNLGQADPVHRRHSSISIPTTSARCFRAARTKRRHHQETCVLGCLSSLGRLGRTLAGSDRSRCSPSLTFHATAHAFRRRLLAQISSMIASLLVLLGLTSALAAAQLTSELGPSDRAAILLMDLSFLLPVNTPISPSVSSRRPRAKAA